MTNIEPLLKKIDNVLTTSGYPRIDVKPLNIDVVYLRLGKGKMSPVAFMIKDYTSSLGDRESIRRMVQDCREWCEDKLLRELPVAAGKWAKDGGYFNLILLHQGQLQEEVVKRSIDRIGFYSIYLWSITAINILTGDVIQKRMWSLRFGRTVKTLKRLAAIADKPPRVD